jgi:hypothetical protein
MPVSPAGPDLCDLEPGSCHKSQTCQDLFVNTQKEHRVLVSLALTYGTKAAPRVAAAI